jgi:hypothetical protein
VKKYIQAFWKWFGDHEAELFDFEADQERIFDQLSDELAKVNPDLTFEFGPKEDKREFVVSAGGIERAFPAVISLTKAAPRFERWQVTAFRPRRTSLNIVNFGGKRVDPKDVQFSLLHNGHLAGLHLFIPGYTEEDTDLKQIGYLLLDDALGEYDVETNVGFIEMLPPENDTDMERYPLADLSARFDELMLQLGKLRPV